MKKDESHCDLFHLSVTVTGELEYSTLKYHGRGHSKQEMKYDKCDII